jgi:flagellar hook-associated protein 1
LRAGAAPNAVIRIGADQVNVTASVEGARLGALLEFRHDTLAGVQGDSMNKGELDQLAEKIMSRLNQAWPPPAHPFFIAGASPISVAHTLSVNPALTPAMLDAVEPGPPPVANGKALQLAALANPVLADDKIDGFSVTSFYGRIAGKVGGLLNDANFDAESQTQLLAQAEAFRDRLSGISLDEEALYLLEFQRAYEASARMVSVLDEMLQTAVNLGRS